MQTSRDDDFNILRETILVSLNEFILPNIISLPKKDNNKKTLQELADQMKSAIAAFFANLTEDDQPLNPILHRHQVETILNILEQMLKLSPDDKKSSPEYGFILAGLRKIAEQFEKIKKQIDITELDKVQEALNLEEIELPEEFENPDHLQHKNSLKFFDLLDAIEDASDIPQLHFAILQLGELRDKLAEDKSENALKIKFEIDKIILNSALYQTCKSEYPTSEFIVALRTKIEIEKGPSTVQHLQALANKFLTLINVIKTSNQEQIDVEMEHFLHELSGLVRPFQETKTEQPDEKVMSQINLIQACCNKIVPKLKKLQKMDADDLMDAANVKMQGAAVDALEVIHEFNDFVLGLQPFNQTEEMQILAFCLEELLYSEAFYQLLNSKDTFGRRHLPDTGTNLIDNKIRGNFLEKKEDDIYVNVDSQFLENLFNAIKKEGKLEKMDQIAEKDLETIQPAEDKDKKQKQTKDKSKIHKNYRHEFYAILCVLRNEQQQGKVKSSIEERFLELVEKYLVPKEVAKQESGAQTEKKEDKAKAILRRDCLATIQSIRYYLQQAREHQVEFRFRNTR